MHVSEIRVNQIRVNQGLGVLWFRNMQEKLENNEGYFDSKHLSFNPIFGHVINKNKMLLNVLTLNTLM